MKVKDLLNLIPQEELEFLAAETNVDYQVKKLNGITIFQLLIFSYLSPQKISLRIMEEFFKSMKFQIISGIKDKTTRYNSIRDRICNMNPDFFEKIFKTLFDRFNVLLDEKEAIIRYDSTMIGISSKLVEWGMKVGSKTNKVQLKYTFGMKGSIPCDVKIFDNQKELSEDMAIPKTILSDDISKTGIIVFDRGVQSRQAFNDFTKSDRLFVTRANTFINYRIIKKNNITQSTTDEDTLFIEEDLIVLLKSKNAKWGEQSYRLIKARIKETKESIYFLSNIETLTPLEIAAIYKKRWEIEVLFKFMKQHLNFKHLVSRNKNGIKIMLYITLIVAILIIAYKKINKIINFKIALFKFSEELDRSITKQIVILTGGNPNKLPHLFSDA